MAHFAKINKNNFVENVIVVNNSECGGLEFPESEVVGQNFISSLGIEGTWKQTSFNKSFRGDYAVVGGTYDKDNDVFVLPIDPLA